MRPTLAQLAEKHSAQRLPSKKRNRELRDLGYNPDGEDGKQYRKLLWQCIARDMKDESTTSKPKEQSNDKTVDHQRH